VSLRPLLWTIALLTVVGGAGELLAADKKPAVLVHTPNGQGTVAGVDVEVLKDFHKAGLEVDYTDRHRDFTWDRIKQYNTLVLYSCPDAKGNNFRFYRWPDEPPYDKAFVALVERFLQEGGGVLLMAYCHNVQKQLPKPLIDNWNASIPLQHIVDPDKSAAMTRMNHVKLGFTDQVIRGPVTGGVTQIWYPYGQHYLTGITNPLVLGPEWTVVVRASKTARTVLIDLNKPGYKSPMNVTKRFPTVASPPIFATRSYKKGRVALASMWPQFTFTSGKQWLFQGEALQRGLQGKPSHLGKLLANTLTWLSQPSLTSTTLGGYRTDPNRLLPQNEQPEAKKRLEETFWSEAEMKTHRPPAGKLFRGLVGVKTTYSGAKGTIADYARAAKEVGLDFIVLMDDFAKLSPKKLKQMKDDCRKASDEKLLVLPGYAIDNNTGNHMFLYGEDPPWPSANCLAGPNKTLLNQQYQDEKGVYGNGCPVLVWILAECVRKTHTQVGYFNFGEKGASAGDGHPMRMEHLRTYGMGTIWFYRDGKLVEDVLDNYLLTAQCNIPPAPGAVNIVTTPDQLKREVKANRGLVVARGRSLKTLQMDALLYPHTYAAPNVFPTTGPIIQAWPECWRVMTFAIEDFVTGRNLMPSPIHVTSDVGLKQIDIYDGQNLFRRFQLNGAKEFKTRLLLNGTVQRNLVLIAEDVAGGKAVSYARRTRKFGDMPEYCGDRVNIGDMFMAHGPTPTRFLMTPAIHAGLTWDGGAEGRLRLVHFANSQPLVQAAEGTEGRFIFNQVPVLEAADEGMRMMRSHRTEVFPPALDKIPRNSWWTYGPLMPSKLFTHVQRFTQWQHPAHKVVPVGFAGAGFGYGAIPTLSTTRMTFKRDLNVQWIRLANSFGHTKGYEPRVLVAQDDRTTVIDTLTVKGQKLFKLKPGDWIGFFSPHATNSNILTIRRRPIELRVGSVKQDTWITLRADLADKRIKAGQTDTYEFATMSFPVDAPIDNPEDLVKRQRYLEKPTGLRVTGARRLKSPGILDYESKTGRFELQVPSPDWKTYLTLPVRCSGMNRRWSAGLWLKAGYVLGNYGRGENRYRPLSIDSGGRLYFPVPVDLAEKHHVVAGHPVVADKAGKDLFIQVTQTRGGTFGSGGKPTAHQWHVSVNNPLSRPVTTTLRQNMDLPNLSVGTRKVTLKPGEYRVLQ